MPGLINAHDHLEFSLFPRLGNGPYRNAGAWARDIYHPDRFPVREHLRISLETRLHWGAVKNLLSGVTTVCHHNPYHPVFSRGFAVRVPKRFGWAHSLEFSRDLAARFSRTPRHHPFILHLGEAVDRGGAQEIFRLDALGALDERTILVHAVALGKRGLDLARKRGASLVWCPSSNFFILGRTLDRLALNCRIPAALGTDSTMSGEGDLLDELRFARRTGRISAARLYDMVTVTAAKVMRLTEGEGSLIQGASADILVLRDNGQTPSTALLGLRAGGMELLFVRGEVKVASQEFVRHLPAGVCRTLHPLVLGTRRTRRVFLSVKLPELFSRTEPILGSVVLAGKRLRRSG
jgi:cytosine/adenosine deaminase-related metal-dependent hydrolase